MLLDILRVSLLRGAQMSEIQESVQTKEPIIEDVFKKMKVLEESFTAVDAIAFPKHLKYHYFDLLDGIASMAKETKRQIELKGN